VANKDFLLSVELMLDIIKSAFLCCLPEIIGSM